MSNTLLAVSRNALSPELISEAAKEALILRKDIQFLGFAAEMHDYESTGVSPFMKVSINSRTHEAFETEAPAIASLLEEMTSIPSSLEGVQLAPFRATFMLTINYCEAGTEIAPHRDIGSRFNDRVSRIASLCGRALFGIDVKSGEPPITPVTVEAGDIHELLNPRVSSERPVHWVRTIGDTDRISFVYQENVIHPKEV